MVPCLVLLPFLALIREREVIEDLYKNTVMPADLAPASV